MLAVRWHGRNDVRLDDIPPPSDPGPGEVQLRVRWCGICGTDMEEWQHGPAIIPVDAPHPLTGRTAPLTLGHEFSGVVERVGEGVEGLRPGERVAVDTIVYCGTCHWCRRNQVVRCPDLGALGLHGDGGLAELCNAPASMCLPVPDGVSDEAAALAETLSVGVRALGRGRLAAGEHVAIVGAGAVGLMTMQAARAMGADHIDVIEPSADRRRLAGQLGADATHPPDAAEGLGADVVIECAGPPAAVTSAMRAMGKAGRCVLVGTDSREVSFKPFDLLWNEQELIGSLSHVYDEDFRVALSLLGRGVIETDPVISDRIPLERAVDDGLQALLTEPEKHLKIVVSPDPG